MPRTGLVYEDAATTIRREETVCVRVTRLRLQYKSKTRTVAFGYSVSRFCHHLSPPRAKRNVPAVDGNQRKVVQQYRFAACMVWDAEQLC